jgi:hypothetical protein
MSNIIHLAEIIKDYLRGLELDAEVSFTPEYFLSGNKQRVVFVTPKDEKIERISRSAFKKKYSIDICLIERIKQENEIHTLVAKVENLSSKILKSNFDKMFVTETSFNPLFAGDELRQKHTFISVLSLTLSEM